VCFFVSRYLQKTHERNTFSPLLVIVFGLSVAFCGAATLASIRAIWPLHGKLGGLWTLWTKQGWEAKLNEERLGDIDRVVWNHYVRHCRRADAKARWIVLALIFTFLGTVMGLLSLATSVF
jgi:hypothetical protein